MHVFPKKMSTFVKTSMKHQRKTLDIEEKTKTICFDMLSSRNHWKHTSPEENALPGHSKWHGKCNKKHQKHEKRMLTMKTIRKQWTDFRILLFRKCTFSRGKMSHFVKPTRKQEKNTGKTHEQTWKRMNKGGKNENAVCRCSGGSFRAKTLILLRKKHYGMGPGKRKWHPESHQKHEKHEKRM